MNKLLKLQKSWGLVLKHLNNYGVLYVITGFWALVALDPINRFM
jgi:hypothetical protein